MMEAQIDSSRKLSRLKQAMQNLAETDRKLMELFYYEEHSIPDLVHMFGKSESALKMKMFRIRRCLKQLMNQ
jgi:DNA-directed RNA polymerase specialized sigma24 family protein